MIGTTLKLLTRQARTFAQLCVRVLHLGARRNFAGKNASRTRHRGSDRVRYFARFPRSFGMALIPVSASSQPRLGRCFASRVSCCCSVPSQLRLHSHEANQVRVIR